MSMSIERLTIELLGLPVQYRALLAEKLIASLDEQVVPDNEALWIKETERRFKEIQDGTAVCRPAEDGFVMRAKSCSGNGDI
jgi:hypothetical protein